MHQEILSRACSRVAKRSRRSSSFVEACEEASAPALPHRSPIEPIERSIPRFTREHVGQDGTRRSHSGGRDDGDTPGVTIDEAELVVAAQPATPKARATVV